MTGHEGAAERLAAWLDGLGLVEQLEAEGMLRLQRDPSGGVVWLDAGTGAPLQSDELDRVERLFRSHGEDPTHGVPVPLVQAAHLARVRRELLASDWLTYDSLAELRGTSPEATRFAVTRAVSEHRLLAVPSEVALLVPAFQLDPTGSTRPELLPLLEPLLASGLDTWRIWAWLTRPAALLGGLVPAEAATAAETAEDAAAAARALATRT